MRRHHHHPKRTGAAAGAAEATAQEMLPRNWWQKLWFEFRHPSLHAMLADNPLPEPADGERETAAAATPHPPLAVPRHAPSARKMPPSTGNPLER